MRNILEKMQWIAKNAPLVRHYANMIIHVIDMLDGIKDWQKENPLPKTK